MRRRHAPVAPTRGAGPGAAAPGRRPCRSRFRPAADAGRQCAAQRELEVVLRVGVRGIGADGSLEGCDRRRPRRAVRPPPDETSTPSRSFACALCVGEPAAATAASATSAAERTQARCSPLSKPRPAWSATTNATTARRSADLVRDAEQPLARDRPAATCRLPAGGLGAARSGRRPGRRRSATSGRRAQRPRARRARPPAAPRRAALRVSRGPPAQAVGERHEETEQQPGRDGEEREWPRGSVRRTTSAPRPAARASRRSPGRASRLADEARVLGGRVEPDDAAAGCRRAGRPAPRPSALEVAGVVVEVADEQDARPAQMPSGCARRARVAGRRRCACPR